MRLGALEAGGTKMVCAVGNEQGEISTQKSIPTKTPETTIPQLIDFFKENKVDALGIGCFGPIDLNKESKTYGCITTTPKLAWQNYNIVSAFKEALQVPVGFDTDVNGSVLGEYTFGAAKDVKSCVYITIGTGIGAGIIVDGKLLHGMMHPEAGHILLARQNGDNLQSVCPFHENCLEGLASGPAIEKRYGKPASELTECDPVWDLEAEYIAQALVNYTLMVSPQRIILGGGVMHQTQLFPLIREKFRKFMNGYIMTEELKDLNSYIVMQSLEDKQGILGAMKLGEMALLDV